MHIVLVGPGALGCLLASRLRLGDRDCRHRFTLLDHNAERARMLRRQGIRYVHQDETREVHLEVSSSPTETGPADAVILCVKSYDVARCIGFCAPMLRPETLLVFMQNGVAHLDVPIPPAHGTAAYGTTTEGANIAGPGQVNHAGRGLTQFGFLKPVDERAQHTLAGLAQLFNDSELKARIVDDILSRLWTKLMVNTGINGLTAIFGCANGDLLTLPQAYDRMGKLVREAMDVAAAAQIEVPLDSLAITRDVCLKTAGNISSMLQDVRGGRRTEIDAINGAVVAAGKKYRIRTEENTRLVAEVKALERSYLNG